MQAVLCKSTRHILNIYCQKRRGSASSDERAAELRSSRIWIGEREGGPTCCGVWRSTLELGSHRIPPNVIASCNKGVQQLHQSTVYTVWRVWISCQLYKLRKMIYVILTPIGRSQHSLSIPRDITRMRSTMVENWQIRSTTACTCH
jgi:hypothetical protein